MQVDESLRKYYQQNMSQHYCLLDTLVFINNAFDLSKFVMGLLFKNEKEKED